MQWGKAKFEGIQILYIEFWAGPIPQVLFTTIAEITFLAVVCVGPVCFNLLILVFMNILILCLIVFSFLVPCHLPGLDNLHTQW